MPTPTPIAKTPVASAGSGAISLLHTVGPVVAAVISWILSPAVIGVMPTKVAVIATGLASIWLTYGAHKLVANS
jgi:hypothetical protein